MEQQTVQQVSEQQAVVYDLSAKEIDRALAGIEKKIPRKEKICGMLNEHGLAAMEVKKAVQADFVTTDMDTFLKFLGANGIRTAMYYYDYYNDQKLNDIYKMQESDLNIFMRHAVGIRNMYTGIQPEESDYTYYVKYTNYLRTKIDQNIPRELWLYTIYEGRRIACRIMDEWLIRTGLPTVQKLRQEASDIKKYGSYGRGIVQFRFSESSNVPQGTMQPAAVQLSSKAEEDDDQSEAYKEILKNIDMNKRGY